jgi:uncharacterized protein YecT (DUF1311 family)
MPQVNLADVSGPELRQLLDSSRRRGDAALSYQILQEMAARRDTPADRLRRLKRRAGEPRHIEVDLGDPEEIDGLPPLPASLSAYETEALEYEPVAVMPEPPQDFDRPLTLRDPDLDPEPEPSPRFEPVELGAPPPPKRSRFRLIAGLALGAVLGIIVGWLGGWLARDGMSRTATAAPPIQTAAIAPAPAPPPPPSVPETPPETPPDTALGPASSEPAATPAPPAAASKVQDSAPIPDGTAMELPATPAPKPAEKPKKIEVAKADPDKPAAPAVSRACATAPTPADRAICGDPELKRLQAELRHAYEAALDAHQDRDLLRERQLAWRDTRSTVTDPIRLTRLYEERIRKLNAATAEARGLR